MYMRVTSLPTREKLRVHAMAWLDPGIGFEIRKALVEAMKLLYSRGLINLRGGNASAKLVLPNGLTWIYITPSGRPKNMLRPEDIAVVSSDGTVVSGTPSIEYMLHLAVYSSRPDVQAVVHSHSPATLAAHEAGILMEFFKDSVEARYYVGNCLSSVKPLEPGSKELALEAAKALTKCDAAILEKHGAIAVGVARDPVEAIYAALDKLEALEDIAKIAIYTKSLKTSILGDKSKC